MSNAADVPADVPLVPLTSLGFKAQGLARVDPPSLPNLGPPSFRQGFGARGLRPHPPAARGALRGVGRLGPGPFPAGAGRGEAQGPAASCAPMSSLVVCTRVAGRSWPRGAAGADCRARTATAASTRSVEADGRANGAGGSRAPRWATVLIDEDTGGGGEPCRKCEDSIGVPWPGTRVRDACRRTTMVGGGDCARVDRTCGGGE